eukprot:4126812-Lingulodinium_polyedra.AAC.1
MGARVGAVAGFLSILYAESVGGSRSGTRSPECLIGGAGAHPRLVTFCNTSPPCLLVPTFD